MFPPYKLRDSDSGAAMAVSMPMDDPTQHCPEGVWESYRYSILGFSITCELGTVSSCLESEMSFVTY